MAEMETWVGRSGLMDCSLGSDHHGQDLVCRDSWQGCLDCQAEGSKQGRSLQGSCHWRRYRKVRILDHRGSCLSPYLHQGSKRFLHPFHKPE